MPSSCKEIRAALAACLLSSDCVLIERHTPAECMRFPLNETLPTQCLQLKRGYGECKRGMVDMRKRFRGNYPLGLAGKEESGDGGGGGGSGQLYAGGPVVGGVKVSKEEEVTEEKDER